MHLFYAIELLQSWRKTVSSVALVPTMGHLHAGHIALVREAKKHTDHVVVSIFVNPFQFSQSEDFDSYPRTLETDIALLEQEGVAGIFIPERKILYPHGMPEYKIALPEIQHQLCGATRPGHFQSVATIVAKLFHIVQPEIACFGKKDYQQLFIIKNMVDDLNMSIKIVPVETQRDFDGLALSSRNTYLSEMERTKAPSLYLALTHIKTEIEAGGRGYARLIAETKKSLVAQGWQVDYLEIRDAKYLQPAAQTTRELIVLAAAKIGMTRLIDNLEVCV